MNYTICCYLLLILTIYCCNAPTTQCFPNNNRSPSSNKNHRISFEKSTNRVDGNGGDVVLSRRKSDNNNVAAVRRHFPSTGDKKNNTATSMLVGAGARDDFYWSKQQRRQRTGAAGRRPAPSTPADDARRGGLPVMALVENPDAKYDPANSADLDETMLRRLLGADFDADFSSNVVEAGGNAAAERSVEYPFEMKFLHPKGGGRIPRPFRNLFKHSELPNGAAAKLNLKSQFKRRVYDYLWAYSYCPVQYAWKDLGIRFWPRYIKEGHCYGNNGDNGAAGQQQRSCSIPPGMSCKPAKSKHVVVLRWYCRNWHTTSYCSWIKIHYPILTSCTCSC